MPQATSVTCVLSPRAFPRTVTSAARRPTVSARLTVNRTLGPGTAMMISAVRVKARRAPVDGIGRAPGRWGVWSRGSLIVGGEVGGEAVEPEVFVVGEAGGVGAQEFGEFVGADGVVFGGTAWLAEGDRVVGDGEVGAG